MSRSFKSIAHRGFSSKYVENTHQAFQEAINVGIDMIETDIQLSKDNKWMVYHDETMTRVTKVEKWVNQLIKDELTEYGVLTLEEALEIIGGKVSVYLDIKGHPSMLDLHSLFIILEKQNWVRNDQIYVVAYDFRVTHNLLMLREGYKFEGYKIGQIGSPTIILSNHWYTNLDLAAIPHELATREYIKNIRDQHPEIEIFVYTLNDKISFDYYSNFVDGILSDNAELLVEWK